MEKTNMEKQIQPNELTIFQQLAIESEVASIIDNCANDIEKAYYTFMKFALVEEKYLIAYKHEFMKYVDESVVNDCINYRYMQMIPAYLYVAKFIYDIKTMLGEECGTLRVLKQPQVVVKSKFVVFMRELLTYIPVTAKAIMDGILRENDGDLDFLYPVMLVLKNDATPENDVIEQNVGYDVKIKLLSTPMSRLPILNIQAEEARMRKQASIESLGGEDKIKTILDGLLGFVKSSIENNEDIMTVSLQFGGDAEDDGYEDETVEKLVHVVKKIDKASGKVVSVKEFDTQKDATDYIKNIVKDYPEIVKRFNFIVELIEV